MKKVYLDVAATTPLDESVFEKMKPYFFDSFGNPASVHSFGQSAQQGLDESREIVKNILNADEYSEILFTSGATESNNMVLRGVFVARKDLGKHMIVSAAEHSAVLETVKCLESEGLELTILPVDSDGRVSVESVSEALRDDTILVSVMYVNNELGSVNPVRDIGKMLQKKNEERVGEGKHEIYFHTDAVQAAHFYDLNTKYLKVDFLTLSAHKIHGPKGAGVLFRKKGKDLSSVVTGGQQEFNKRAGTVNVPGVVGFAAALQKTADGAEENLAKVRNLKGDFLGKMINLFPQMMPLNAVGPNLASPHIISVSFHGVNNEQLQMMLDFNGIAVSTGSACSAGSTKPSHVLEAIGLKLEDITSTIRFSILSETQKEDLDYTISVLKDSFERLKK